MSVLLEWKRCGRCRSGLTAVLKLANIYFQVVASVFVKLKWGVGLTILPTGQDISAMARFQYAACAWSRMEGFTSEGDWDQFGEHAPWKDLPVTQQMRHRCVDQMIYLGSGFVSERYDLVHHENIQWKANWKMYLGLIYAFILNFV